MANQLRTYTLTGGEDFVTPPLEIPDGIARIAYNYEQNYDTGFTRINGYRKLVNDTTPGEGPILGTAIFNNDIYIFRNHVGGLTAGMWKATPATYDDTVVPATVLTNGAWIEITDIVDKDSIATTLEPDGYYEFVIHNFKATVQNIGTLRGVFTASTEYNILDVVEDGAGDLGTAGLLYICSVDHESGPSMDAANWVLLDFVTETPAGSHDISGSSGNLYGVDGKNPAFEFDGLQLKQINSTYTPDVPQHIEANGNRLILGFRAGEVALSVLGQPHLYDPVFGAGALGVTDFLTGLMAGPDGVLYIFAKDKLYLFYGSGGPLDQGELKKHSKDVGANPYTEQTLGRHTIFFDTWGITEVAATDTFGDVVTNSLSRKIQNLLLGKQAQTSVVIREKSQYRLYFKEEVGGVSRTLCIIGTLMNSDNIGFTHADYPFSLSTAVVGEIVNTEYHIAGSELGDVYHMDIGNSFDGDSYTSYMTLPFNYLGSPHRVKKVRKIMMNIEALDNVSIKGSVDFSFGQSGHPKDTGADMVNPRGSRWGQGVWNDFVWGGGYTDYVQSYINGHGDNVSVTISSSSATDRPHTLKDITYVYEHLRVPH